MGRSVILTLINTSGETPLPHSHLKPHTSNLTPKHFPNNTLAHLVETAQQDKIAKLEFPCIFSLTALRESVPIALRSFSLSFSETKIKRQWCLAFAGRIWITTTKDVFYVYSDAQHAHDPMPAPKG